MNGVHARTLERALEVVRTKERLAAALDLPLSEIEDYIRGEKALPQRAFLHALDIVASGRGGADDARGTPKAG